MVLDIEFKAGVPLRRQLEHALPMPVVGIDVVELAWDRSQPLLEGR